MVCLADSDIGGLSTMADAGSQTGYALIPLLLILIPVVYVVQDMVVRLSICRQCGLIALAREEMGLASALSLSFVIVSVGVSAIVSNFTGVVAAGELLGMTEFQSCFFAATFLIVVVLGFRYKTVEAVAIALGSLLTVFVVTAVPCLPSWQEIALSAMSNPAGAGHRKSDGLGELIVACIGTVVTPWMLFFQSSAIVEKRLVKDDLPAALLDTLFGSVFTQFVMCGLVITFAKQMKNVQLENIALGEVFVEAVRPVLGDQLVVPCMFLGLMGSALLASLVVSLALAWSLAEGLSGAVSADGATNSRAFKALFVGTIIFSALIVSLDIINILQLNICIQFLNGIMMPVVVGCVFHLATSPHVLTPEYRVSGNYAVGVGILLLACAGLALWQALVILIR